MQVPLGQVAYTCRFADQKVCVRIHTLTRKEKRVHIGKLGFGLWYLVLGILPHGIGPTYLFQSVDPRYLVQGIGSKWFWFMVLSKA